MKEEADPVSYVHAHWLAAMGCVTTGNSQKAVVFMKEAANAVERNRDLFLSELPGLSGVPVTMMVDYSEDLHERLGLLAHMLWFRTYMSIYLVDSGVYPVPDNAPEKIPVRFSIKSPLPLLYTEAQQSTVEKFEDILYGPQGGLLSGLSHLFQNYLPVGIFTRWWSNVLTDDTDCVFRSFRGVPPHGQSAHYAAYPQVTKVNRPVCIRTYECLHLCVRSTYVSFI